MAHQRDPATPIQSINFPPPRLRVVLGLWLAQVQNLLLKQGALANACHAEAFERVSGRQRQEGLAVHALQVTRQLGILCKLACTQPTASLKASTTLSTLAMPAASNTTVSATSTHSFRAQWSWPSLPHNIPTCTLPVVASHSPTSPVVHVAAAGGLSTLNATAPDLRRSFLKPAPSAPNLDLQACQRERS